VTQVTHQITGYADHIARYAATTNST